MITIARKPKGAVLAVGLMLLLVVSMTAVIAMSGAALQEKMVGAVRNESIADNGVETALRDAERWVWDYMVTNAMPPRSGSVSWLTDPEPLLANNSPFVDFRNNGGWLNTGTPYRNNATVSSNPISSNPYQPMAQVPRYMIEFLGDGGESLAGGSNVAAFNPESNQATGASCPPGMPCGGGILLFYRITARSTGGSESVVRAAESTFTIVGSL